MRALRKLIGGAGLFAPLLLPGVAFAHAFGQQFTLPVPFSLYAVGASCALVASFIALFFFSKAHTSQVREPRVIGQLSRRWLIGFNLFGLFLLALTLLIGFTGVQDVTKNLALIFFWIALLLGMTYITVFVGGLWRLMNPFETLTRLVLGPKYRAFKEYPGWMGYLPALFFFWGLIKIEILSNGIGAVPFALAAILSSYFVVSCIGAGIFGVDTWFRYGEFFNVFFGLIGRFAPLQIDTEGRVTAQLPADGLLREVPTHLSALFFTLFMLSSTAFDGLRETKVWADTFFHYPIIVENNSLFDHLVLALSPLLFFILYGGAVYLMKVLTRSEHSFRFLLLRFAYSLIPIAIAYSFAHYFTLLVNEGQVALALISDPWAQGWNLFGTAGYQVNIGLIGAKAIWNIQIAVIVIGHIIATYVAHRAALAEFKRQRDIAIGQLPMLLLMVFYTVFGLWILSLAFALP